MATFTRTSRLGVALRSEPHRASRPCEAERRAVAKPWKGFEMKEWNVVFHYSVRVEADDEDTAENMAWKEFGQSDPTNMDEFVCTVEEMES